MKRVLFPFVGDTIGGSHISVLTLIGQLRECGFEPVVGLHGDGPLADYLDRERISVDRLPSLPSGSRRSVWSGARKTRELIQILRSRQIDLVHTNDWRVHFAWWLPCRLYSTPHVWHQRAPGGPRIAVTLFGSRVITISEFTRRSLPWPISQRAHVIWNPVEPPSRTNVEMARQEFRMAFGLNEPRATIGFIANFADRKRPEFFVRIATQIIRAGFDDVIFPMFGEANQPWRDAVERLIAQEGIGHRCKILGPQFPIDPWISACTHLVAPARREAFGRTLVEGMHCGALIVASDEAGHKEIVEHGRTGFLLPPEDGSAFASCLVELLENPELERRVRMSARDDVRERYSAARHAALVSSIYRSALGT